jgi:hypothetical protein
LERTQLKMTEGDSWWWRFFDFLFTNSQLNVYAGARKVRPPPAPTIKAGRRIAIAGRSVRRCRPRRLEVGDRHVGGALAALPLFRIPLRRGFKLGARNQHYLQLWRPAA